MENTLALGVVIGAKLGKNYFNTFDTAEQKATKLGAAFANNDKKLKAANGVIKYKRLLEDLRKKQERAGGTNTRLARGINEAEKRYKQAKKEAKGYGLAISSITKEQKKLAAESAKVLKIQTHLNKQQKAARKLGALKTKAVGAMATGYGVGRVFGKAFELEDKKLQLGDVITGENTEVRLQSSLQNAKAFARNSLASEADIMEIDYSLRSSGLNDEAAKFGATIVSKVATVTKGSAGDVGFIIGDTFNNIGNMMEGSVEDRLTRIGDVFTKTKNLFSIKDFNQLGEGLKEGLAGAISNKVSLEQTSAIIGQINNGMLKGSSAGTGFNAMLRQLPTASKEMNFKIVRNKNDELDAIATIENINTALSGMSIDEKAVALQKYFGDEGKKAIVPLLGNLEQLKANYKEVQENSTGTFDEGYQRRINSASGQWLMLNQNFSSIGTTIASVLLPTLNSILAPIASVMGGIGALVEKVPAVGYVLGGVAVGFTLVTSAVLVTTSAQWVWNTVMASNSIGTRVLSGSLKILGSAFKFVGKSILWVGRVLLMNPIGLAITGIALAAFAIYKYWKPIKNFFSRLWGQVKTAFDGGIGDIGKLIVNWSPLGLFYKAFAGVFGWFGIELPNTFTGFGASILSSLTSGARSMFSDVRIMFSVIWADIKMAFSGGIGSISELIINWSPLGLFYKAFAGVLGWFGVDLPDTFAGFGKGIIGSMIDGIKSLLPDVGGVLQKIPMPGWLRAKLGFNEVDIKQGVDIQYVQPDPQKTRAVMQAGRPLQQNHIHQLTVNNPTSNVEVEKAVTHAMGRQYAGIPLTDMDY